MFFKERGWMQGLLQLIEKYRVSYCTTFPLLLRPSKFEEFQELMGLFFGMFAILHFVQCSLTFRIYSFLHMECPTVDCVVASLILMVPETRMMIAGTLGFCYPARKY